VIFFSPSPNTLPLTRPSQPATLPLTRLTDQPRPPPFPSAGSLHNSQHSLYPFLSQPVLFSFFIHRSQPPLHLHRPFPPPEVLCLPQRQPQEKERRKEPKLEVVSSPCLILCLPHRQPKKKEGSAIYPIQWVTDRTSPR